MLNATALPKSIFWFTVLTFSEIIFHFLIIIFVGRSEPFILGQFYFSFFVYSSVLAFFNRLLTIRFIPKLRVLAAREDGILEFKELSAFFLKVYFLTGLAVVILIYFPLVVFFKLWGLETLPSLFTLFAMATPFALIDGLILTILKFLQKFKQLVLIQIVYQLCLRLILIYLLVVLWQKGIIVLTAIQTLALILSALSGLVVIFGEINLLGLFRKIQLKTFGFSGLSLANALSPVVAKIALVLVAGSLLGFEGLGKLIPLLYLPFLIYFVPSNIFGMFLHLAVIQKIQGRDIQILVRNVAKWTLIISFPILLIILVYPRQLTSLVFGQRYLLETSVVQFFGLAFFIQMISWIVGRTLIANRQIVGFVISNYLFALLLVVLLISFTSTLAIKGAAIAYLLASLLDLAIKYSLIKMKFGQYAPNQSKYVQDL